MQNALWVIVFFLCSCQALVVRAQVASAQISSASAAAVEQPLLVSYVERPPYFYTITDSDGPHVRGFIAEYTQQIMRQAGISAEYVSWPFQRIVTEIKRNNRPYCALGFYRNSQRQRFAQFTLPLYREPPIVALLLRKNLAAAGQYTGLASIYQNPDLTVGFMKDYSYGAEVDRINRTYQSQQQLMLGKERQLLRLLAAEKIHFLLVAPPEIHDMVVAAEMNPDDFASIELADIHRGNNRYLMCSKAVSLETIAKLNRAIRATPIKEPK
jgi:polar amino acid transport system substrate-binding protein